MTAKGTPVPADADTMVIDPPAQEEGGVDMLRECTRCDGEQHLIDERYGMGKYRCSACEMVIGFDLEADPVEFMLSRGVPAKYTKKNHFGTLILGPERRL